MSNKVRFAALRRLVVSAWLLVASPLAADPALTALVSPPASARVGARSEIGISVAAAPGLTLHALAPLFVDLEAPDALGLERMRLERADAVRFESPQAAFRVGIRPTAAGSHPISARIRAWVCRGDRCRAVETTRVARVTVP